jgi:drug/metabolite transporter (DMT)-like permease
MTDKRAELPGASPDWAALGAALLTVVLWASAFVGIRAAAADLSPGALAVGRLMVGSVVLGALALARGGTWPSRRDLLLIAISGLIWYAVYNVALNAAETLVDAGTAAMLVNVGPILIAILAGLFLAEGFPPRLLIGSAIAFGGAAVIGLATSEGDARADAPLGIALCLVAAVAYAAGVTLQKPALARVTALRVTWIACTVGMIATLPFAPQLLDELGEASVESIAWLVYLGAFPTAVAFTTWAFALSRSSAGRLGSTTYLVPPVAIVMAWIILGEVPPALAIIGGVLCIGGVIVARNRGGLRLPVLRRA